MAQGLDADRGRRPAQARALYLRAQKIAYVLLAGPGGEVMDDDRVAAFVVTHLNLADALVDDGRSGEAAACLCAAHRTLMSLMCDETASASLRMAAGRHSRETHAALILHRSEYGDRPEIMAVLGNEGMLPAAAGACLH
ncbi:hypothetical protein [Thauera linaloolentis]|nr:hypothetical protein [Thauera linaloolentis]MCM8564046.1 hypothetical protein [Thauera linaloolentis]